MIHIAVFVGRPYCNFPIGAVGLEVVAADVPSLDYSLGLGFRNRNSAVESRPKPPNLDNRSSYSARPLIPSCSWAARSFDHLVLASFQPVPVVPSAIQPTDSDLGSSCGSMTRRVVPLS